MSTRQANRLKLAELTSGIGALVLGSGLGALFARELAPSAPAIVAAGLLLHAWGMYDKHRLERGPGMMIPVWSKALYWICWSALLLVVGKLIFG